MELAREEKCEFLPFMGPHEVHLQNGHVSGITFYRTEVNESGEFVEDYEQTMRLKANYIISAFGSGLFDEDGKTLRYLYIPQYSVSE